MSDKVLASESILLALTALAGDLQDDASAHLMKHPDDVAAFCLRHGKAFGVGEAIDCIRAMMRHPAGSWVDA